MLLLVYLIVIFHTSYFLITVYKTHWGMNSLTKLSACAPNRVSFTFNSCTNSVNTDFHDGSIRINFPNNNNMTLDIIHLCTITTNVHYTEQLLVMLRSVMLFTSHPVEFHVFYEKAVISPQHILKSVGNWNFLQSKSLRISFIPLDWNGTLGDIKNFDSIDLVACGVKLVSYVTLLKRMTRLDSVIYVDSDFLFLADIKHWWKKLEKFDDRQVAALSPAGRRFLKGRGLGNKYPDIYPKPLGLNAGLMVLNLTRMRSVNFYTSIIQYLNDIRLVRNDQTLINLYFKENTGRHFNLPCGFNFHMGLDSCKYSTSALIAETCGDITVQGVYGLHGSAKSFVKVRGRHIVFKLLHDVISTFDPTLNNSVTIADSLYRSFEVYWTINCDFVTVNGLLKQLNQSLYQLQSLY